MTFGVYWLFWYYRINREMRDFGASRLDAQLAASRPWRSVLAVTVGRLAVVPPLVSPPRCVERTAMTERLATGR
jgi:hypothetical protein